MSATETTMTMSLHNENNNNDNESIVGTVATGSFKASGKSPVWCCPNATNEFLKCDYGICNDCKLCKEEEMQKLVGGRACKRCKSSKNDQEINQMIEKKDAHPPLVNDTKKECQHKFFKLAPVTETSQFTKNYKMNLLEQGKTTMTKCCMCKKEAGDYVF